MNKEAQRQITILEIEERLAELGREYSHFRGLINEHYTAARELFELYKRICSGNIRFLGEFPEMDGGDVLDMARRVLVASKPFEIRLDAVRDERFALRHSKMNLQFGT